MQIESVHIYGFGKWIEQSFSFPQKGKVEICGNNEAGKTTLRQFILYIFFGLTTKEIEQFLPKKGATIGGRIKVSGLMNQAITIERILGKNKNQAVVLQENGEEQTEAWLRKKLNNFDRSQYQEIYTFDTHDLQKIQKLDNNALHEVLLAVGMTGTDRIYYAEKELEKKRVELFKPYGKKPIINQLFQELNTMNDHLYKAKQQEKHYRSQLEEIEQIESEIQLAINEKASLENYLEEIEKQLTHYKLIEDYYLTYAQLKREDTTITFPSDGLSRLKSWKEMLLPLQSEENVLLNNIEELDKKFTNVSPLSHAEIESLEQALDLSQQINHHAMEIAQITDNINNKLEEIESKLKAMQINVKLDDLKKMDLPFYLEEHWSDLATQTEKLAIEMQYVDNEVRSIKKIKETLHTKKQNLEEQTIDEETIRAYQEAIDTVKEKEDHVKQQSTYQKWSKQFQQQLSYSNWIGLSFLLASIALFVSMDRTWMLVVSFIAIVQNGMFRLYGKVMNKWLKPSTINIDSLNTEDIHKRQKIIHEQAHLKNEIMRLDKDLQLQQMEQLKVEERSNFLKERKEQVNQKVIIQTESYPFLENVELAYWSRAYQQLSIQQEKLTEVSHLETQLKEAKVEKEKNEKTLETFDLREIEQLPKTILEEKETKKEYSQLLSRKKDLQVQVETNLEKQKPYQKEINHLFQLAEVDGEEPFIEKGEYFSKVEHATKTYYELHDSLIVLFTEEQVKEIEQGQFDSMEMLQKQMNEQKNRLQEMTITYEQKQAMLSDQKASTALLEHSEDVSVWNHKLALKQEELEERAKEWAMYQLAFDSLQTAKTNYSKKYMPQIFEQAGSYFKRLTINRYRRIYIADKEQILIEDNEGFSFYISELSQATKDQLYIAIRFALSHVMASRLSLPFLIDDGFVHFDKNRKEKVLELLDEMSEDHQVLYFTTHQTEANPIRL